MVIQDEGEVCISVAGILQRLVLKKFENGPGRPFKKKKEGRSPKKQGTRSQQPQEI